MKVGVVMRQVVVGTGADTGGSMERSVTCFTTSFMFRVVRRRFFG